MVARTSSQVNRHPHSALVDQHSQFRHHCRLVHWAVDPSNHNKADHLAHTHHLVHHLDHQSIHRHHLAHYQALRSCLKICHHLHQPLHTILPLKPPTEGQCQLMEFRHLTAWTRVHQTVNTKPALRLPAKVWFHSHQTQTQSILTPHHQVTMANMTHHSAWWAHSTSLRRFQSTNNRVLDLTRPAFHLAVNKTNNRAANMSRNSTDQTWCQLLLQHQCQALAPTVSIPQARLLIESERDRSRLIQHEIVF